MIGMITAVPRIVVARAPRTNRPRGGDTLTTCGRLRSVPLPSDIFDNI